MNIACKYRTRKEWEKLGATPLVGYQLRYIYIIDKKSKLNCENIPFSEIDKYKAGMYKGENITYEDRNVDDFRGEVIGKI